MLRARSLIFAALLPLAASASCVVALHGSHASIQCGFLNLGADGMGELEEKLEKLPATSMDLDLQHNAIGVAGAKIIGVVLGNSLALTSLMLQLDGNSIGDEGAGALGVALGKLKNLVSLSISMGYNDIGPLGLGDLGAGLSRLERLESLTLELKFNHVSSSGLSSLGMCLARLAALKFLKIRMWSNSIDNAGARDLAASLPALKNLAALTLDLEFNRVDDEVGGHDLWTALHSMKNLTSVTVALPPTASTTIAPQAAPGSSSASDVQALRDTIESMRAEIAALRQSSIAAGQRKEEPQQPPPQQQQHHQHVEEQEAAPSTTLPHRSNAEDKLMTTTLVADVTEDTGEESSIGSFLVSLFAVALLIVSVGVGLQARGYNVAALFQNASSSVRDFVSALPQSQQNYRTNLPDEGLPESALEAPMVQHTRNDNFNPDTGPDLATRVDRAAARATSGHHGSRDVSFEDLINQNLNMSRQQASDRME